MKRMPFTRARAACAAYDFMGTYVDDLPSVVDIDAIKRAGVRIGADPLGGASVAYWGAIAERHGLDLTVVNPLVDPTWRFMTLDWDEKIRMDCSSPRAMASLIHRKDEYQIATGNDADADRHGIVTPDAGLMNPNHFLAVAIAYLFSGNRPDWPETARIGKTLVSSSMIDRVAASLDKPMVEVPVGFKWFVPGLIDGSFGFGGEESAGASFLRRDGSTWTTDKDGLILCLLASEILAVSGNTPERALRRSWSSRTATRRTPASTRPPTASRRPSWPRSPPTTSRRRRWPARRSPPSSPRPRATAPRSAASRSSPRTRGSPRAPRAPRTSTRSTPSRSKAETTSRRSRRKRARWSRLRWADGSALVAAHCRLRSLGG